MTHNTHAVFEILESRLLLSADVIYALNVGGPTVDLNGQQWIADSSTIVGVTPNFVQANATTTSTSTNAIDTSRPSVSLTGFADPILKQDDLTLKPAEYMQVPTQIFDSQRFDQTGGEDLTYLFDVLPGKYRVDLYFSEPTHSQSGLRVMDILVEGVLVADDLDIADEAGGTNTAIGRSFMVDSDASLSVALSNQIGDGVLQGIRVVSATGSTADLAFNPTTLNATNTAQINTGDVVQLMPGQYHLADADIQALFDNTAGRRDGVTYLGVPGQTVLDFTDQPEMKVLVASTFGDRISGLVFDGLTFLNAGLTVQYSTGARITNTVFDGFAGKTLPAGTERVANFWRNPSAEFTNNYFRWDNTSVNVNAIGVGGSTDGLVADNYVEGLLRKAIQLWKYDGMTARGNMVERWSQTPGSGGVFEDHGIYVHDSINVLVEANNMRGWSDTASGGGLKIKNVSHVEVTDNDFFTSGILGRVAVDVEGPAQFEQVWIHNNRFHQGGINIWTPTIAPAAVRIENNLLQAGNITAIRDVVPSLFNQTLDFGPLSPGGVFNNSAIGYTLASGINQSGNNLFGAIVGDISGDGFVGITDLNIILSNWNQTVPIGDHIFGDIAGIGDGFIGISDLNVVLSNWNAGTPPASEANATAAESAEQRAIATTAAQEVLSASVNGSAPSGDGDTETRTNHQSRQRMPAPDTNAIVNTHRPDRAPAIAAWGLQNIRGDAGGPVDEIYIPRTMRQQKHTILLGLWDDVPWNGG